MTRYKKQRHRHFTEFRDKDYRIARSMKEAYGFEPMLYVEESPRYLTPVLACYFLIMFVVLVYAVVLALQF
jgi:hypothetical protein